MTNNNFIIKDYTIKEGMQVELDNVLDSYTGEDEVITIPEGVKSINSFAFTGCKAREIQIPNSVEVIYDNAFDGCKSIEKIIIKGSPYIGHYAFYNCTSLKEVDIPNGISGIGDGAFDRCPSIEKINIPCIVINTGSEEIKINIQSITMNMNNL